MKRVAALVGAVSLLAGACGGETAITGASNTAPVPPTATTVPASTTAGPTTTTVVIPDGEGLGFPGPYGVGQMRLDLVDSQLENLPIPVLVMYPAVSGSIDPQFEAAPDRSGAPYPIVVGSSHLNAAVGAHLASHGFVFAGLINQNSWGSRHPSEDMINHPLEFVVALDGFESLVDHPLAGVADVGRSGVIGYSFGSWDALMMTGARVDPDHYAATCAERDPTWSESWWVYVCGSTRRWDWFVARAERAGIVTPDGLWRPMGDERIKAAMPMAPEGFDLVGPRGLAEATVPILLIAGSEDTANDYQAAAGPLYEHYPEGLGSMITFKGADHSMIGDTDVVGQIRRFALAFFGLHLGGEAGYAGFLTQSFVEDVAASLGPMENFDALVWGVAQP